MHKQIITAASPSALEMHSCYTRKGLPVVLMDGVIDAADCAMSNNSKEVCACEGCECDWAASEFDV